MLPPRVVKNTAVMQVPAARAGGRPTNSLSRGIITIPPPIPSNPPRIPATKPPMSNIIKNNKINYPPSA